MFTAYKKISGRSQYYKTNQHQGANHPAVAPTNSNISERSPFYGTTAASFVNLHKKEASGPPAPKRKASASPKVPAKKKKTQNKKRPQLPDQL